MSKSKFQFAGFVVLALAAALVAEPALAQRGRGQAKKGRQQPPAREQMRPPEEQPGKVPPGKGPGMRQGQGAAKGFLPPGKGPGAAIPPQWMERLQGMTPEDQERFMNNNQRFRMLPPERQEEIRERLRQWNSMTPEQRQRIREIERMWQRLTPEDRQRVRQELMPRLQQMAPQRRQAIVRRWNALRGLTDEELERRLNDPSFTQGMSREEQELLRELARLRIVPPPPATPPPDNPPRS